MNKKPKYKNGKVVAWENETKEGKPYITIKCSYLDIFAHFEQIYNEMVIDGKEIKMPTGQVKLNLWFNEDFDKPSGKDQKTLKTK